MTGKTIWLYTSVTLAGGAAGGALIFNWQQESRWRRSRRER
jgi:hypothetical protein